MMYLVTNFVMIAQADPDAVAEFAQKADLFDFGKIVWAIVLIGAAMLATRLVQATAEKLGENQAKHRFLLKKVASFTRVAIFGVTLYMLVMTFFDADEDRTALIGLGGTLAVTIGFALKDTASSVMAGILILVDQPFQVGDRVSFGDTYGEVTEIGLRSVRIVTLDDSEVSIPNNKFLTEAVVSGNSGALDMMLVIKFHVAMDADLDLARRIIYEAGVTSRYVYLNKPVTITMKEVVAGMAPATLINCKAYVIDIRYESAMETDITARVRRAFREHGIQPPRIEINSAVA